MYSLLELYDSFQYYSCYCGSIPFWKKAQAVMNELDKHIEVVEVEIVKYFFWYFDDLQHITMIDGIQLMSAILIISEIGVDMTQFETDKQLWCWCGTSPANNESEGKNGSY